MNQNYTVPISIIVAGALIAGAVLISNNFQGVLSPKSTSKATGTNGQAAGTTTQSPPQQTVPQGNTVKVSIDDDPVMGDPEAPVTLIEFSDFECPFCKRSFDEMLPQLKNEYVGTGKVKFVYRDFPLSFHDPLATQEALAATCAREQGGDEVFFKYHDEIFKRTQSNGNGMPKSELYNIASDIGLDDSAFRNCLDSEKYKGEVSQDIIDGTNAGVTGTPGWFVGKTTSNGIIDGQLIIGAQPFSVFVPVIERLLNE